VSGMLAPDLLYLPLRDVLAGACGDELWRRQSKSEACDCMYSLTITYNCSYGIPNSSPIAPYSYIMGLYFCMFDRSILIRNIRHLSIPSSTNMAPGHPEHVDL
jgi:hypothetical protein